MVPGQLRRSIELGLLILTSLPCCDQVADDGPNQDGVSYSQPPQGSGSGPGQTIQVVINRAPQVVSMHSSTGLVTVGASVQLGAVVEDADGDAVTLRWSSTCPGRFAPDDAAEVTFLPGSLPTESEVCAFVVAVEDGHRGNTTGTLTLSTVPPKVQVLPVIGAAAQSSDEVAP